MTLHALSLSILTLNAHSPKNALLLFCRVRSIPRKLGAKESILAAYKKGGASASALDAAREQPVHRIVALVKSQKAAAKQ